MTGRSHRVTPDALPVSMARSIATMHLVRGEQVYRCHRRSLPDGQSQGSWFFSSGAGRFDLPAPDGTLNLARQPIGAVKESLAGLLFGKSQVRREEIDSRKLVRLTLVDAVDLSDLSDPSAARAGIVTGELTSFATDYSSFQSMAKSFRDAGCDGIAAPLRFSTDEHTTGLFLFGKAGPRKWPVGDEEPITPLLIDRGYEIEDAPDSGAITFIEH